MSEEKVNVQKLEDLIEHEKISYDNYFKVVYSSKVKINNEEFKFRYTEEDGVGITLEILNNDEFSEVDYESKFEWHFITALLSQSHTTNALNSIEVGVVQDFGYNKEMYDSAEILELC